MSTIRDPAYITDAGRTMMTAGGDVTYTKAVLYDQDISHLTSDQIKALTIIGSPLREVKVGISDKQNTDRGTTVILEATFQNDNLANDLPYTAVGFFAQKGSDEKLIAVAVANTGAYLAATSPDGVATDALDLKLAITIGDATNVTATVDPAGSVTPATLNGAINKVTHDLTAKIDVKADQDDTEKSLATKADKTTVESDLATKADQSSLDETNAEVAKKANSEDVTKQLATKANVSDVDDALSKKDDTADVDQKIATVNKSVSDLSDTVSANKTATDASLATKANASDVADNVKTLQANIDTKADKATVDEEIGKIDFSPYARIVDVYSKTDANKLLDAKADKTALNSYDTITDVDSKIKTVTDLANTKVDATYSYSKAELDKKLLALSTDTSGKVNADQVATMIEGKADKTDVDAKIKTVTDLANTKADASDVYTKKAVDDAFSTRDSNITNAANLAKQAQDTANTKANSSDVYIKADVDGKTSGTIITAFDVASKTATKEIGAYNHRRLVDQGVLGQFADAINAVNGTNRIANAVDVNTLTGEEGKVHVYLLPNSGNTNTPNWISDKRGNLIVINYDGNAKTQLWFPVGSGNDKSIGVRYWEGKNYPVWNRIAIQSDIDDLLIKISSAKNAATQANSNADSRLPLAGGSMNTNAQISFNDGTMGKLGGLTWNGSTDSAKIYGDVTANDNLDLAFDLGDDGSNHFSFRRNGSETSAITSDGHYTGTVDWGHVNGRPQDQIDKINTDNPLFRMIANSNTWNDIFGVDNGRNVLTSLRINSGGSGVLLNDFAAGIGFGGADTKGVLSVAYQNHQARITGGNGAGPVWSEDVAWKSDINDLRNQVQQLRENQFEVQTFTDATAAANWEAQRQGKRMAIVNK